MLLQRLLRGVVADEVFEDGQHVPAIIHDSFEQPTEVRLALRFAVPLGEDGRRDFDIAPQLLSGVAPQEKAIEKRSFPLRKLELLNRVVDRIGRSGHGRKMQFTDFRARVKTGFRKKRNRRLPFRQRRERVSPHTKKPPQDLYLMLPPAVMDDSSGPLADRADRGASRARA